MGAGASAMDALPTQLDKTTAKKLAGSKFDEAKFNRCQRNGKVSREDFLKVAGSTSKLAASAKRPTDMLKGDKKGGGKKGGLLVQAKAEAASSSSAERSERRPGVVATL